MDNLAPEKRNDPKPPPRDGAHTQRQRSLSRRAALTGAAFAVPTIVVSTSLPAIASSVTAHIVITPHSATGVAGTSAQPFSAVISGANASANVIWTLPAAGYFSFDAAGRVKTVTLPGTTRPTIYALTPFNTAGSATITATISGTTASDSATYNVTASSSGVTSNGAIVNDTATPERGFLSFGGNGSPVMMVRNPSGQTFSIPAVDGPAAPILCNGLAMTYVSGPTAGFYWQPFTGAPTQLFQRPSARQGRTSRDVFVCITLGGTLYWICPASGKIWDLVLVLGPHAHRYDIAFTS